MDLMTLSDRLREAVPKDPRPQAEIARAAKIHPKTFSAFMHGRRGLSVKGIENLVAALGFELRLEVKLVRSRCRR